MEVLMSVMFVAGVLAIFGVTITIARRKEAADGALPFVSTLASSELSESTQPSFDGAKPAARPTPQSAREARLEEIRARKCTGLCLYCDKNADFAVPQLKQIKPFFDWAYRRLNVVPVNAWKIELTPPIHIPHRLCVTHAAIARSHLERKLIENQADYAAFVERQRHEMYEFEAYALDERMLDDANTVKRGKKPKKPAEAPAPAQRGNLKAVAG